MKTAILLNEDLSKMRLGLNTTLAYILGAVDLGHEVYLIDARNENPAQTIYLKKENCQNLIDLYKKSNETLLNSDQNSKKFVKNVDFDSEIVDFDINSCDLLVQRLDPTHFPFPPYGKEDYRDFLRKFFADKNIKNKKFNYPVDCYLDKELPVEMKLDIEVKSWTSFVEDEDLVEKILKAKDFSGNDKIVLKPDNSGQSMGVFAIEFCQNGKNLAEFIEIGVENLQELQIYHVKSDLEEGELQKIILFLLFCQSVKFSENYDGKKYQDLSEKELINGAKELYNSKIIAQPFILGVSKGDIRVNIAKIDEKFEVFGVIFRKSLQIDNNFTTCVTGDKASPVAVKGELSEEEIADLINKTKKAINVLNSDLSQKYSRSYELGFDFILKGDGKTVLLNEVNHACPALLPVAELIRNGEKDSDLYDKLGCPKVEYDGGLGLVKNMLKNYT